MPERFSASVAGRQMACHASANLDLAIQNWEPPVEDRTVANAANEGTSLHEILEELAGLKLSRMRDILRILEYLVDLRSQRRFTALIERSFEAHWLPGKPPTKPDLVLFVQDEIHVIDYKLGKIPVEVRENHQLLHYAACVAPLAPKAKGVKLHLLQPQIATFESWYANTNRIRQYMDDSLAAHKAINAGDTTFQPGDHCMFCEANPHGRGRKGKPFCPELMQLYYPQPFDEDAILDL